MYDQQQTDIVPRIKQTNHQPSIWILLEKMNDRPSGSSRDLHKGSLHEEGAPDSNLSWPGKNLAHHESMALSGPKRKTTRVPSNFLFNRNFRVHVGPTLSNLHNFGVPQGSIFAVTLLSIKIYSIIKCQSPGVDNALYVNNLMIFN